MSAIAAEFGEGDLGQAFERLTAAPPGTGGGRSPDAGAASGDGPA
jgi:hypothetical protein